MKSRSSPSPRNSDWKVWQWAFTVPGSSALSRSLTSPGSTAPTGPMNAIRPSVIAIARSATQPPGVRARSGRSLTSGPASPSDRHDVVTAVDVDHLAGDPRRERRGEEERGVADLAQLDVALERRLLRVVLEDLREAADAAGGQRVDRPRRDRVHTNPPRAHVGGEIPDGRFQRRLRHAHDVVAGGDLFGAVVRHGQDGRLARLLEQRQRRAGEADQGVRGDVVGDPEALARRLAEGALQIFPLSERHRVYEDVERAGLAPEGREDAGDLGVGGDVARIKQRAGKRAGQRYDVLLQPVALVREGESHPGGRERLSDGPGDRALVGDAEDDPRLAVQELHGPSVGS